MIKYAVIILIMTENLWIRWSLPKETKKAAAPAKHPSPLALHHVLKSWAMVWMVLEHIGKIFNNIPFSTHLISQLIAANIFYFLTGQSSCRAYTLDRPSLSWDVAISYLIVDQLLLHNYGDSCKVTAETLCTIVVIRRLLWWVRERKGNKLAVEAWPAWVHYLLAGFLLAWHHTLEFSGLLMAFGSRSFLLAMAGRIIASSDASLRPKAWIWLLGYASIHYPFTFYAVIKRELYESTSNQIVTAICTVVFFGAMLLAPRYKHVVLRVGRGTWLSKCVYQFAHYSIWTYVIHISLLIFLDKIVYRSEALE